MTEAIRLWWWVFLVAALIVTLVDVYLLMQVVKLAQGISILTGKTLPAARGIASNTAVGDRLGRTPGLLGSLGGKAGEVARLTEALGKRLGSKER